MVKKIGILLLVLPCYFISQAQVYYDSLLTLLDTRYPQEKIYMQLDKTFYNAGETVWFKAYIKAGTMPSQISKTMYAELLDENGELVERKTMPIFQAGAASTFDLPTFTGNEHFYIRAYTDWMLNFDTSFLYTIPVNLLVEKKGKKEKPLNYTVTFFPEGGDLIDNLETSIAFKTNDQDGKPFEVKGTIVDAAGSTAGSFLSTHRGMGKFTFTAKGRMLYKALWKDPAGIAHETELPLAKWRGAAFNIRVEKKVTYFTITRPAEATDEWTQFFVIAQMNQQTVYGAKINLSTKTTVTAPISTDSIPDGIMQVTLFNKNQEPVAERIVFVNNNSYSFFTDVHMADKNISPKGKNVLQVDVGGTLSSNLSVSITDAALDVKDGVRRNIFSQMLLSSDIKGYVYDPGYYFTIDEDSIRQQLDLVMMTNGWRRFSWDEVLAGKFPQITHLPRDYISLQGAVFGLSKAQLINKSLTGVLQSSKGGGSSFISIPVQPDGSFNLDGIYFFDTVKMHYQFNNDKNKTLTSTASFTFKNGFAKSPVLSKSALSAVYFSPLPAKDILRSNIEKSELYLTQQRRDKIKVLESVTVTGRQVSKEDKLNKEYASGLFNGGNARIFAVEDDPFAQGYSSVLDYLRGKVAGLQIDAFGQGGGSITRRGSNTDVFLNEMNADIQLLQSTPMSDVAMIKVFDPPFFGATGGGAGGAVAVYTKKGSRGNTNVQGLNATTIYGYSGIKEFYQPDYDSNIMMDVPDYRSTLYWNPFLLMDAKNKRVTIPFYNNDSAKKIRVIIEGMNELGQLTREEKIFE